MDLAKEYVPFPSSPPPRTSDGDTATLATPTLLHPPVIYSPSPWFSHIPPALLESGDRDGMRSESSHVTYRTGDDHDHDHRTIE